QPAGVRSCSPIFQAGFVLKRAHTAGNNGRNGHTPHLYIGGLLLEPVELEMRAVPFDWNLMAEEAGDGLRFELQYNSDLFNAGTIERWMACFRTLLRAAFSDSDRPIDELPMLDDHEPH